jgi:hypothetical protein
MFAQKHTLKTLHALSFVPLHDAPWSPSNFPSHCTLPFFSPPLRLLSGLHPTVPPPQPQPAKLSRTWLPTEGAEGPGSLHAVSSANAGWFPQP